MDTPKCQCGLDNTWVLCRRLEERMSWDNKTKNMYNKEIICSELWVFCVNCGQYTDNQKFIDFLGSQ